MKNEEIRLKVKKCIEEAIGEELLYCDLETVSDTDSLLNIGLNSLNAIKLIMQVEDVFQLEFEDEDIALTNWVSISDIINLLKRRECL